MQDIYNSKCKEYIDDVANLPRFNSDNQLILTLPNIDNVSIDNVSIAIDNNNVAHIALVGVGVLELALDCYEVRICAAQNTASKYGWSLRYVPMWLSNVIVELIENTINNSITIKRYLEANEKRLEIEREP